MRYRFLGYADVDPNASLVVPTALTVVVLGVCVVLFRRGYGILD